MLKKNHSIYFSFCKEIELVAIKVSRRPHQILNSFSPLTCHVFVLRIILIWLIILLSFRTSNPPFHISPTRTFQAFIQLTTQKARHTRLTSHSLRLQSRYLLDSETSQLYDTNTQNISFHKSLEEYSSNFPF